MRILEFLPDSSCYVPPRVSSDNFPVSHLLSGYYEERWAFELTMITNETLMSVLSALISIIRESEVLCLSHHC